MGLDAFEVEVETDLRPALPKVVIVGLPDASLKESQERVESAIKNSDLEWPSAKIVVNLAVFLVVTRALLRGERGRVTARIAAGGPALDAFEPSVLASLETGRARRALRRNAKRDGGRRAARAVARAQRDALDALQT